MAGLTLDSGALVAAERNDRRFWAFFKESLARDVDVTVPAAVLAQVWRGPRSAGMVRLLRACAIESLDESLAKDVGMLLSRSGTTDVVDAVVVAGAARRRDDILTGDPGDIERLCAAERRVSRVLDLGGRLKIAWPFSAPMHPAPRRCSSVATDEVAPSSRLAGRAPRRR